MTIADQLTKLTSDITNAYTAIEAKGGTIPAHKNTENLATSIESISGGGGGDTYDIPYFSGGQYGAIAYLDHNHEVAYYTATSSSDLSLTGAGATEQVKLLPNGWPILKVHILAYSFGTATLNMGGSFLAYCYNLQELYGFENATLLNGVGNNFMISCTSFNRPITFPSTITSIGTSPLDRCASLNSPVTLPPNITKLPNSFMANCYTFNQPITLPSSLTSVGNSFLIRCYSFNQDLTFPATFNAVGNTFMQDCRSFTSTLNLGNSAGYADTYSLASMSANAPLFTQGATVITTTAEQARTNMPNNSVNAPYRNLTIVEG